MFSEKEAKYTIADAGCHACGSVKKNSQFITFGCKRAAIVAKDRSKGIEPLPQDRHVYNYEEQDTDVMKRLEHLFKQNQAWSENIKADNPDFFTKLAAQQKPEYLWIGCSDSRVPANQLTGLIPGDIFVHRNVANQVVHTDFNCLSVLQYAVDVLKVKHVIVCGHYGCGGVIAAMKGESHGLIDNWLLNIRDVYDKYQPQVDAIADEHARANYLCEVNVAEQVANVCNSSIVKNAWERGQELAVHGWIYSISDGLLQDLGLCMEKTAEVENIYQIGCDLSQSYK